ncbi:MAG: SMK killer toxin resistance protein [Watsoniomyces obsoletus]|nr:MAG: SMK killer toxin resistance protein [Watsoniomyces obsoletus]
MLPTPSTAHVSFEQVYEPAEDSYLLLDTLSSEEEINFLHARFGPQKQRTLNSAGHDQKHTQQTHVYPTPLVLEVGVGSGVVLAFVTSNASVLFARRDVITLGTDVNEFACLAASTTVHAASRERHNNSDINPNINSEVRDASSSFFQGILQADLTSPLRSGMVDILIFNPPYVPTSEVPPSMDQQRSSSHGTEQQEKSSETPFERDSRLLALSYAGGCDGMEVTNRLLEQLPDILGRPQGIAYILLCAQNHPEAVKTRVRQWGCGWMAETVGRSGPKGGWEKLQVIRIWRDIDTQLE